CGLRAIATKSGTSPTQASGHRLKSGKERTSSAADRAERPTSMRVGTQARARLRSRVRSLSRAGTSSESASSMRASLTEEESGVLSLESEVKCFCLLTHDSRLKTPDFDRNGLRMRAVRQKTSPCE